MTNEELIKEIELQRALMITVATGGPRIDDVNKEYQLRRTKINRALIERDIEDPNSFPDLWSWHGKGTSGDLATYASRRQYIAELYAPLIDRLQSSHSSRNTEPTGWERVDRTIDTLQTRLEAATTEEEYQEVGFLCRETLISLAQAVYDRTQHQVLDGTDPSKTDAKRMLEAYIAAELVGDSNEASRRHVKASFDLANSTQHRRTATFRDAALCAEATISVLSCIAIISGRRNP
jgi:hypothetical protein